MKIMAIKNFFILPTIGLFFIFYSFINFNDKILHPSYYTLLPIIGIFLIIFFLTKMNLYQSYYHLSYFFGLV